MSAKRNYGDLLQRAKALVGAEYTYKILAEIAGYPIVSVRRVVRDDLPTALVTGGTHGDEPAGVEAALAFLERDAGTFPSYLNFEVLICLNAYGYAHDTRHNFQGVDVNWAWDRSDVPEVQVIKEWVEGRRFQFVFDCHEDWESPGFYLYELRRKAVGVSRDIVAAVERVCPLNLAGEIEGMAAAGGVVDTDVAQAEKGRGKGIPLELFHRHTDHLLTVESPTELAMSVRVAAHLAALDVVIAAHLPKNA
jgi:murein peptide amidase A